MCPLACEQQPLSEPQGAFSHGQWHLQSCGLSDTGHAILQGLRGYLDPVLVTQPLRSYSLPRERDADQTPAPGSQKLRTESSPQRCQEWDVARGWLSWKGLGSPLNTGR